MNKAPSQSEVFIS